MFTLHLEDRSFLSFSSISYRSHSLSQFIVSESLSFNYQRQLSSDLSILLEINSSTTAATLFQIAEATFFCSLSFMDPKISQCVIRQLLYFPLYPDWRIMPSHGGGAVEVEAHTGIKDCE